MRYIMSWCYKIYIVCAFILKFKKYFRQPVRCYFKAFMLRRYFSVLTIHAPKITSRKEHCSRTALTGNTRFFPHMQCGTCHIKLITLTAYTDCPASVNTAVSRTKSTFSVIIHRNISITLSNAAAVFSKSALVCASDKNSDSNCDGAR